MRKITLLFSAFLIFSTLSFAIPSPTWCGDSYITIGSTWYTGSNNYIQPAGTFDGKALGSFSDGDLILGGELQVYISIASDATLFYKIDNGTTLSIALPVVGQVGNNSKHYGSSSISLSGLADGDHTIEVWFEAVTGLVDNNGGANFVATFTKSTPTKINLLPEKTAVISTSNGAIKAKFEGIAKVEIYSITGSLISSSTAEDEFNQEVSAGAYVVVVNGSASKVFVK